MNVHRLMAAAAVATLAAGPVLAASPSEANDTMGQDEYAGVLADTQIKCYDLMVQFDNSVRGMKSTKAVRNAKAMRIRGERQCGAEEDIAVVKKGAKTLEHALTEIGQKPKPAS